MSWERGNEGEGGGSGGEEGEREQEIARDTEQWKRQNEKRE